MKAPTIESALLRFTAAHSGHESNRKYLGMSQIHRDEDDLVRDLRQGASEPHQSLHQLLYLGNLLERDILQRLTLAGITSGARPDSIVADFDERFRGHPDAITTDGDLVEIKTCTESMFNNILDGARIRRPHFQQVQCYMRHGNFDHCHVLYFSRETGRVQVRTIPYLPDIGADLDAKARRVLAAYDELARRAA